MSLRSFQGYWIQISWQKCSIKCLLLLTLDYRFTSIFLSSSLRRCFCIFFTSSLLSLFNSLFYELVYEQYRRIRDISGYAFDEMSTIIIFRLRKNHYRLIYWQILFYYLFFKSILTINKPVDTVVIMKKYPEWLVDATFFNYMSWFYLNIMDYL